MAKADPVLYVAEGTTRVGENAVCGNLSLETVIFPSSLRSIADFAFFGCENLENVTFSSYYAPTLEGNPSVAKGELEFITVENVDEFPGFDDLYKYNYMFYIDGWTGRNLYHSNFKAGIGSLKATKMNATIPENCFGYDGLAYKAYFNIVEDANSGVVAGKYAIAFEEAVYKLPENIDRFDRLLIEAAINAYNALAAHEDEKQFVSAETIAKFERARVLYNVNVVDGKIGRLFGMYNTEYCFNLLKDATEAYLALTDEEKEMVSSPETLDSKKAALALAMGVEDIDFSLSYSENLPTEEPPVDPPVDDGPEGWVIALIVIASVVVAGGVGACLYFFVFRKKKVAEASAPVAEVTSEEENPDAKED